MLIPPTRSRVSRSPGIGRTGCVVVAIAACTALGSCTIWEADVDGLEEFAFDGRRPIYFAGDAEEIVALPPRPIVAGGSFALAGDLLYVVDVGTGVHIVDNRDSANTRDLSFVQIYGVTTVTVEGDRMFANNFTDLVTIDVSDPARIRVLDRDPGLFAAEAEFPGNFSGYFECYDPSRGRLVGWEEASLTNPLCRTF